MKNIYWLITFLFLLMICCEDFFIKDKEFSIETIPYTRNELKIDGYYSKTCGDKNSNVLVFYRNGVLFGCSGLTPTNEIEDKLNSQNFSKTFSNMRACWGPFEVNKNILRFEYYDIFGNNWHTCIAHCIILNDTTFNIEKITFSKTGKEVNVGKEGTSSCLLGKFHFKQFYPKPDSTNTFIK